MATNIERAGLRAKNAAGRLINPNAPEPYPPEPSPDEYRVKQEKAYRQRPRNPNTYGRSGAATKPVRGIPPYPEVGNYTVEEEYRKGSARNQQSRRGPSPKRGPGLGATQERIYSPGEQRAKTGTRAAQKAVDRAAVASGRKAPSSLASQLKNIGTKAAKLGRSVVKGGVPLSIAMAGYEHTKRSPEQVAERGGTMSSIGTDSLENLTFGFKKPLEVLGGGASAAGYMAGELFNPDPAKAHLGLGRFSEAASEGYDRFVDNPANFAEADGGVRAQQPELSVAEQTAQSNPQRGNSVVPETNPVTGEEYMGPPRALMNMEDPFSKFGPGDNNQAGAPADLAGNDPQALAVRQQMAKLNEGRGEDFRPAIAASRYGINQDNGQVRLAHPKGYVEAEPDAFMRMQNSPERQMAIAGKLADASRARDAKRYGYDAAGLERKAEQVRSLRGGQGDVNPIEARIRELESEYDSLPNRGLNQSFSDMIKNRRRRSSLRNKIERLSDFQKTTMQERGKDARAATTAAQKDRDFALNVLKEDRTQREKAYERRNESEDAFRERIFPLMDIDLAEFYGGEENVPAIATATARAKALHQRDPRQDYFASDEGQLATSLIKRDLVEKMRDEFGAPSVVMQWLGLKGGPPTQADIENLNFKGWKMGEGDMLPFIPEFITTNKAFKKGDAIAYFNKFNAGERYALRQLINRDNKKR